MIVEVDAQVSGDAPHESDIWGIICRARDYDNYYMLGIDRGGFAVIRKLQKREWYDLAYSGRSYQFRGGTEKNYLRADCLGNKLTLFVNGYKVVEAEDSTFDSGVAGLYVQDTGDQPLEVLFDNFLVSSP